LRNILQFFRAHKENPFSQFAASQREIPETNSVYLGGFADDYCADLLWRDGRDFIGKTVVERRERLQQIITPVPESRSATTSRIAGSTFIDWRRRKDMTG
jgi:hypothetical protein